MSRTEFVRVPPPASIGPYRVVRELGRGGVGHVYECVHIQLRKRVAIKILREHLLDDQVTVQRFLREGRAVCHIDHPHVVDVYELGSDADVPYLVMELLEGSHLGARLRTDGPLALPDLAELMLPVLSAVSAAHAAGIVHRDLKPSNIMLSHARDGRIVPKVLDFGTSKLHVDEGEQLLTVTGAVLGTIHYMSPEQTRAPKDVDAKSDQYSLGLILYECATGKKPFSAESSYELMHAIMTAPIAPPSALEPSLPKAFDELVLRAMSRLPRDRYPSVQALGAALLPFASSATARLWTDEFSASAVVVTNPIPPGAAAAGADPSRSGASWRRSSDPSASLASSTLIDRVRTRFVLRSQRWTAAFVLAAVLLGLALAALHAERSRPRAKTAGSARSVQSAGEASSSQPTPRGPIAPVAMTLQQAAPASSTSEVQDAAAPSASDPKVETATPSAQPPRPAAKRPPAKQLSAPLRVHLGDNGAPILE